jgi:hypothetical protein
MRLATRPVLVAAPLLLLASWPAAAQCIVNPGIIGSPCVSGSRPFVRGQTPQVLPQYIPPQPPVPHAAPPVPAPRQAQSLSREIPSYPPLPLPSQGVALRCVTPYGTCVIPGGAIPAGACLCGSTTGVAR